MNRQGARALCLALGVTSGAIADAQTGDYNFRADDRTYITPYVGAFFPDSDRGLVNHDFVYGAAIGHEFGPWLNLELNFNATNLNEDSSRAFRGINPGGFNNPFFGPRGLWMYGFSVDALGILNRDAVFSPYGVVGLGLVREVYRSPGPDFTHFAPEAGIGAYINVWESPDRTSGFSLRPELKARFDDPGHYPHFIDYMATMGFQFSFGGTPVAHHAAITNYETAPPAAYTPPPPPPPPPPPAPSVLPESGTVTLTGVTFAHDSADLTATSHSVLDNMATGLKQHPGMRVEIQGHTDSTGSAAYNEQLSQRRADAVRQYLLDQGVSPDQVVARGFGETQPVDSNATAAGRAANRRVVARVLSNPNNVATHGEGETHLATPATPR